MVDNFYILSDKIRSWWIGDNDTGQAILVLFSSNLAHHYLCEP